MKMNFKILLNLHIHTTFELQLNTLSLVGLFGLFQAQTVRCFNLDECVLRKTFTVELPITMTTIYLLQTKVLKLKKSPHLIH